MISRGLVAPRFAYRDRRKGVVAEFDLGTLADVTDHPFRLQCEQYKLCEIMLDRLAKMANVTVKFDAEVVGAAIRATPPPCVWRRARRSAPML